MSDTKAVLALKPYIEAVRNNCQLLSFNELCDFICAIAQEVSPRERAGFLEKLSSYIKQEENVEAEVNIEGDLLDRIQGLKEEISERQGAIEDGTYYEEYGWDDYGYDEEVETLSEEQREELQTLFAEVDHLFLSNELELAGKAYESLLDLFRHDRSDEDLEFYLSMSEYDVKINWRETRSRYCRCIYETSDPAERVTRMGYAMQINVNMFKNMFESRYAPSEGNYPLLQDVFDAKPGELADWEDFLREWQRALEGNTNNRAFVLFLEAINWLGGTDGVACEVRKQGIPVGYLFWIERLIADKAWKDACLIAQEALENMPEGKLRAQAAEMLSLAGKELGDNALILTGTREHFYSTPYDSEFALLIEEANRQNVRDEELEKALSVLKTKEHVVQLRIKVLLMLGRLKEASELVDTGKPLGWSYGAAGIGVFFGGLLTALAHADPQAVTIQSLLKRYAGGAGYSYFSYSTTTQETDSDSLIVQEIQQGLQNLPTEDSQKQEWMKLARKIGEKRIDAIVSNQHRKSYNRAADVLGALMECCLLNDQQAEARLLLETYRNQKYKRYSAFRREVDMVLRNSNLLRTLR